VEVSAAPHNISKGAFLRGNGEEDEADSVAKRDRGGMDELVEIGVGELFYLKQHPQLR
jgi:hypothetical protein